MKPPSKRQLRIGELIRHTLSDIFLRESFQNPALQNVSLTVLEVSVSPDGHNATAYILPLGGDHQRETVIALNQAAGFIRGLVGRQVDLRHVPRLTFELDQSFDRGASIDELLLSPHVAQDLKSSPDHEPEEKD